MTAKPLEVGGRPVIVEAATVDEWRSESPAGGTVTHTSSTPIPALVVESGQDALEVLEGLREYHREQLRAELVEWLGWNLPDDPGFDGPAFKVVREAVEALRELDVRDPIVCDRTNELDAMADEGAAIAAGLEDGEGEA